ncbi:MAG: hypothetical protein M3P53_03725 [Actinomycetota bacterium]|jgi:hypothetical protein|nr:hypothetical protein [Actinomycetota bacterium]
MAVSVPSLYVTKIIGAGSGTAATSGDSSSYQGDAPARPCPDPGGACYTGDGAEYVAVCLPAFSPATVHRDHG